ncbi:fungal-specific transcription factor domain-containing protein [Roridomyces roridus]|uniref:Fungal-specific transcription factor domain-containing protein n=1 Tax=Roridomyces roridus TaxID=1738132 RepID=A0AAD7G0M3_9AGAR|nr:fungal-specific transcription factor domain-containing protein [Roridomyces roridus]
MSTSTAKSRKLPAQSCDRCRTRKSRCDGSTMLGSQCSYCLDLGEPCTYDRPSEKRGPKKRLVEELQHKIAILESKLRTLSVCSLCSQPLQSTFEASSSSPDSETGKSKSLSEDSPEPEEEISEQLIDWMSHLHISTGFLKFRDNFYGSASTVKLVQDALTIKEKYLGHSTIRNPRLRRPMYWGQLPWEMECYFKPKCYTYPSPDLIDHLVKLYFTKVHPTFPVLHRPTFERDVAAELQLTHPSFGQVLLAVLATGALHSDDPRVMIEGNPLSSGFPFISQIQIVPNILEPTVYDAQFYSLMAYFSLGGSSSHLPWVYLGLGVRVVQFHGQFLRADGKPKLEDELWNRAFWSIFILDGWLSASFGRTPALRPKEYDVDPPLEVDDEYWDSGFVQPLGKPSSLSFFVHFVRLFEILGEALRRLHASKALKTRLGWTAEQEQQTVAELDSLMQDLLDSIPTHLRWDPVNLQDRFIDQSALLHSTYYWLQITIHRPYIHQRTPSAGPSLFICLTAARSALGVLDSWMRRPQCIANYFLQTPTFIFSLVLLLNIFANRGAGVAIDADKDLARIKTAAELFKACETTWQKSGRLWELLQELQSFSSEADPLHEYARSDPFANGNLRPGISIEQLLFETDDLAGGGGWNGSAADLFMPFWPAATTELINMDAWDASPE